MGYLYLEKATWEAFDGEGYYHTGDKGRLDSDNNLVITGRIKEILITSGGEKVEPQQIELAMQMACPIVSHAIVVGEGQKFVSLLLTLKVIKDPYSGTFTRNLSPEATNFIKNKLKLSNVSSVEEVKNTPEMRDYINDCVERANLKAINRVAKVKKWVILDEELDVLSGELTPTYKVKRKYIMKKHEAKIAMLYAEPKL